MKSNIEVSDEEMEACFGTRRKCDRNCRMKQYCQEEAKEHAEDRRRRGRGPAHSESYGTEKVSPSSRSPVVRPFLNHFMREALLPCVKVSGWT